MFDKLPIMLTTNVLLTFDIWSIDNYPVPFKNSLGTLSIFKLAMFQNIFFWDQNGYFDILLVVTYFDFKISWVGCISIYYCLP